MRLWLKFVLFLSSYTPLFLIISIRYYTVNNSLDLPLFLIILSIAANIIMYSYIRASKTNPSREVTVKRSINRTSDSLNYIITYIVGFIGLQFGIGDLFTLLILIGVIFIVVIRSNLILINPILNIVGYSFYGIEVEGGGNIVVITKKDLKDGDKLIIKLINNGVYLQGD